MPEDLCVLCRRFVGSLAFDVHVPIDRHLIEDRPDIGLLQRQRRRLPQQASWRQMLDVPGINASIAKCLDERGAVAVLVVRDEIGIGGDERAQIFAESDVDRWAIVERANADAEKLSRNFARLARQSTDEICRYGAFWEHAGPRGREPHKIERAAPVNLQERVEDGRNQDGAAVMCFGCVYVIGPLRFLTDPDFLLPRFRRIARLRVVAFTVAVAFIVATGLHLYDLADVVAERAIPAGRLAELDRELPQQVLFLEVAAGFGDLVAQCFRQREMLKERDDVGESFMEGEYVRIGR